MKSTAERRVEALAWASVLIWLGMSLLMGLLAYVWLVVMVLSIILLSSAIYQRARGWHTSLSIWVFGIWMAIFSVVEVLNEFIRAINDGEGLDITLGIYLGIALVSMGVAAVLRNIQAPGGDEDDRRDRRARERTPDREEGGRRPFIPRQVESTQSSGWSTPSRARAEREPRAREHAEMETVPERRASERVQQTRQPSRAEQQTRARPQSPGQRRQGSRPSQRRTRRAEEPSDLEARVEDIIRRNRQRRGASPDDEELPY
jgi:hypothetical protein